MPTAMSLVFIHQDPQLGSVYYLNALINPGSGQVTSTSPQGKLALPDVVLYLPKFLILMLQLLLVDSVTLHLSHGTLVIEMGDGAVDLWMKVVVVLKKLELTRGVSTEGSGRRERGGLKGFDILMMIAVNHAVHQRVFSVFDLDILRRLHFAAWEMNVEGNVVSPFI